MRRYSIVPLIAFLLFIVSPTFAETITFTKEYTYQASEFDSKNSCRTLALEMAKRLLLEDLAAYLDSETEVKDMRLTKDQVTTYSAGIVSAEIMDERWDGKSYWLKAKVSAATKEVEKALKKLVEDKSKLKELEEIRMTAEELTRENDKLRRELEAGAKSKERDKETEAKNVKAYENTITALNSVDWFRNGLEALIAEQNKEALDAFAKAIELKPDYAAAYYNRAEADLSLGNYQQAIGDFSKTTELKPDFGEAYYGRGLSYVGLGNYQQAINDCTKAIELKPDLVEAYYGRALSYVVLGNYQQAVADFKTAARLGDKDSQELLKRKGIDWQ